MDDVMGQQQRIDEGTDNPVWVRGRWGARYHPSTVSPAELQARSRAARTAAAATVARPVRAEVREEAAAPRRFSIDAETVRVDVALDRSWDLRTSPRHNAPVTARVPEPAPARSPRSRPVVRPSSEVASRARLQADLVRPAQPPVVTDEPFPAWLDARDLQVRMTHDLERTTRHYEQRVRTQPECGAGWVGLAVVALSRGQVKHAANLLIRCHELDAEFPSGRLVKDSFEGRPELWYDLARALVETKRRAAYECADLILQECVRCERTSVHLRRRAIRVRADITLALDARQRRDRKAPAGRRVAPLAAAGGVLLAVLAALACLGLV